MSEILDIAHDMARDLLKAGAMDEINMRKVKAPCLPPKRAFQPEDIRRIRMANHVSQAVYAAILGIGKTTVNSGSRGRKKQAARRNVFSIILTVRAISPGKYPQA